MTPPRGVEVAPIGKGRCVERIVDALERAGVDTVYGIPGGAISPLYDALVDRPSIHVVHVRHESSAAFMAIGHARMRPGSLPVVLVTSGPGVTNVVTGLAAARGEGAPLLVIAGEVARSRFGRNALQEGSPESIDVINVVRTVTRSAASVSIPTHASFQIAAAAQTARAKRGPVFLSLPLDVALSPAPQVSLVPALTSKPAVAPSTIDSILHTLRTASAPLLLVGSGALRSAPAVRMLADRLRLPVITSPKAKGIVDENAPNCLGVFGYGGHPSTLAWLEQHKPDVVLALGCGLSEVSTNSWSPLLQASRTMIQVDVDPSVFGRNYRVDLAIEADCDSIALALLDQAGPASSPRPQSPSGLAQIPIAPMEPGDPLTPGAVIQTLQDAMPVDTVFTADIGEHLLFAIHYLTLSRPDQFIASTAFGSMGSGIGAAVGAKLARPDRPVVAICGDYGFQMFGMEIATCVQEGLSVIFVVINDSRMRMVEAGIQRIYGRGLAMHGPTVDFAAIAAAHGARGLVVRSLDGLREAIGFASEDGPTVLDVRIGPKATFPVNGRVQEISNFTDT